MTAGGFLCYAEDVFCLFISIEIRRGGERRGASSMGAIKQKNRPAVDIVSLSGWLSYHLSATENIPRAQFGADLCKQLVTSLKLTCDKFTTISSSRSPDDRRDKRVSH